LSYVRKRIVRLLPTLDFGGVESRALLQSELHDRDQFELRVCTFHSDGAAAAAIRERGIPVDVLGQDPSIRNLRATSALARYLAQRRPDVLHASIVEANFHSLLRPPSLRGRPRVIVEEVGSPSHGRLARNVFRLLYRRADRIVGVSQATCDYLTQVDRAPPDKVRLIYNCAAQRFFADASPPRPSFVERRAAREPFRLLLVGRMVEVKNRSPPGPSPAPPFRSAQNRRRRSPPWGAGATRVPAWCAQARRVFGLLFGRAAAAHDL
jgi:glycosyltransferase involved in cell wall biosynthesis